MGIKSVKLDEEAYKVVQQGKVAGGFASISAFLKHVFNLVGLSTFEPVHDSQERREMRQKLDKIHALCEAIRNDTSQDVIVEFKPVELRPDGPKLRTVALDKARQRDASSVVGMEIKSVEEDVRLFDNGKSKQK